MPEGDTIHRSAAVLRAALLGKELTWFDAPRLSGPTPSLGSVIEEVSARGKHLNIAFDDGLVLHTHMRMTGSWHVYRQGERWRRDPRKMRCALEAGEWIAVCFSAPVVEVFRARDIRRHLSLGTLGPDLCTAEVDLVTCVERMGEFGAGEATIAEVLLDQRIAAGVGNVYKSEILWFCGLDPFTPLAEVPVDVRLDLMACGAQLLQANLDRPDRRTFPEAPGGLAVYGRTGKPCLRCGQPIAVRRHGELARVTYWCPACQIHPAQAVAS